MEWSGGVNDVDGCGIPGDSFFSFVLSPLLQISLASKEKRPRVTGKVRRPGL